MFAQPQLVDLAEEAPLTRPGIEALGKELPNQPAGCLITRALECSGPHAATALAFAAVVRGQRLPHEVLYKLLPDLEDIAFFPPLAAAAEEERADLLIELVERGRMSWEREALALFLATELLAPAERPSKRLLGQLRRLAREPLDPSVGILLGAAAERLDDENLCELAGRWMSMAALPGLRKSADEIRRRFTEPPLEALPMREAPTLVSGYTVKREEPRIGRNQPCPCGSGRKYKKCCGAPGAKRPGSRLSPSGFGRHHRSPEGTAALSREQFRQLRPREIAQLEPGRLDTRMLADAIRRLAAHRRFEDAERFMEAFARGRDAADAEVSDCRAELISAALSARETALAERQLAALPSDSDRHAELRMELSLSQGAPDALERLVQTAREALEKDDSSRLADLAYSVLEQQPALGILVARGCLDPTRVLDGDEILHAIGQARDRLGLPADEPWSELFDLWIQDALEAEQSQLRRDAGEQERDLLLEELDALREQMADARSDALAQERQLRAQKAELDALSAKRDRLLAEAPKPETQAGADALERERRRMRLKIDELKGRIAEGNQQRRELRRQLSELQGRRDDQRRRSPGAATAELLEPADAPEAGDDAAAERPRELLVPQLERASKSLLALPRSTAARALECAAKLAAGDPDTWKTAKKMRAYRDLITARVGIHHRMVFRIEGRWLQLLDVVHRKDLKSALEGASS